MYRPAGVVEPNFTSFPVHEKIPVTVWEQFNPGQPYTERSNYKVFPNDTVKYAEVIGKRNAYESFYRNPANPAGYSLVKSLYPVNFQRNGEWIPVDAALRPIDNGVYEATDQWDPVGIHVKDKNTYLYNATGKAQFNDWTLYGINGNDKTALAKANWNNYTIGADGIRIIDIFPGIDAEMRVSRGGIKTSFIVHRLDFSQYGELYFEDSFKGLRGAGLYFRDKDNSRNRAEDVYADVGHETAAIKIAPAFGYAKNSPSFVSNFPYHISGNKLAVVVPVDYIVANLQSGDVIIDPLVQSSGTLAQSAVGTMFNATCGFTNSCDYTIAVTPPVNSTVTSVASEVYAVATAPCGRENFAYSLSIGTCYSPGPGPADIWQANGVTGPGTMLAGFYDEPTLYGCLPAPSCTPAPINVNFRLFRGCVGPVGCDNSCIGLVNPLSARITGYTVEVATIAASATTFCQGQNGTFSTTVSNGVGPYSAVNWSYSNTGTPSLGTGNSIVTGSALSSGNHTLYARATDACGVTATRSVSFTVKPLPVATLPAGVTICNGGTTNITPASSITGTTYSWTVVQTGVTGASGGAGASIVQTLTATGTTPGTAVYTITPTANGCAGTPVTYTVTVKPVNNVLYVDALNGNDANCGDAWTNSLQTLSAALKIAKTYNYVDSILVAKGTYYPTGAQNGTNRDSSFLIQRGKLKFFGGYPNGGGARDVTANPTVLSGDIGAANDSIDNSYHLMVIVDVPAAADSIVIDGFTFTKGNADGGGLVMYGAQNLYQGHGAGLYMQYNQNGQKTALRNLTFLAGTARILGGGIELVFSSPYIQNCEFRNNRTYTFGGALANDHSAGPYVTDCRFTGNVANSAGGAVFTQEAASRPVFINCSFTGNKATTPTGSGAAYGGAMYNRNTTDVIITKCIFTANSALSGGGVIYNNSNSVARINYGVFDSNVCLNAVANAGGGAFQINSGSVYLYNSVFTNNTAGGTAGDGGGAVMAYGGTVYFYNNTLLGNTTQSTTKPNANGISILAGATCYFNNSIAWGNPAGQLHNLGTFNNDHSLIEGTAPALPNLDLDPQFVNAGNPIGADGVWGTADDGLQLTPCSPAANMGDNTMVTEPLDIAGNARVFNTVVDMGAYELQTPVTPLAFTDVVKTYGDADAPIPNFTNCSGLPTTFTIADNTIASIVSGNLHILKAGATTVTAHTINGTPDVTVTLTVNPKQVTVSLIAPVSKVYDGNANATISTANLQFAVGDVAGADDVAMALSSTTALYDTKDVGTGKPVTVPLANISLTGTTAANYVISNTADVSAAIGDITPLAVAITADAQTKVYGDADPALTYTVSPAIAPGDVFTGALTRAAGEDAGVYAISQGSLALSGNYTTTYNGNNLTITAKTITVTVDAKTKVYGDADPALTYTYAPALVGADTFTGSLLRNAGENVGPYAINQGTLALSSNYTLAYIGNTLTITPKTITVTVDAKTKTYGDADPALTYTYTPALVGGDAFSGSLLRTAGENVGPYAINQGTLALNSNYTLAFTGNNFTITAKTITVTVEAKTKVYGDADPALTYTFAPALIGADVFTGSLLRTAGENTGVYPIDQHTLALSANYTLVYIGNDFTITPKTIIVTADAQTKIYGDPDPVFTYTYAPALVGTDVFTGSISRLPGENAGAYAIGQNTLALSSNYTLVYAGADLIINKAVLTVTAVDTTICLSDALAAVPVMYSGFKNGDNASALTSRPGVNIPRYIRAGNYPLTPQGGVSGNYTFNYVNGQLTVLPEPAGSITQTQVGPGIVNTPGVASGIQLNGPAGTGYTYAWSTGETTSTIVVKANAAYQVLVTHPSGCSTRFTTRVLQQTLIIPNIFSPNGDGIHDRWVIENLQNFPGNVVQVYNRYGQAVFKMTNYTPWDGKVNGKEMPVGTYYYIIDPKNGEKPVTGYIDIIR
ncbi:MBG domain-containing protein [Niastella populi]|nr:MBG domain-containing protein [Niastella populi]